MNNRLTYTIEVEESDSGQRIDKFLSEHIDDLSRSRIKSLILEEQVILDSAVCDNPSKKVVTGQSIVVTLPEAKDYEPQAENIPLDIIYEDNDLLVLNKQAGLVVHPGAGNWDGTLVNALLYYCKDTLSGIGGVKRPGIVHRLDKDTTGLMVVAKNDLAHKHLSSQLSDRSLTRKYQALCWNVPSLIKGNVKSLITRHPNIRTKMAVSFTKGKEAQTFYTVLKSYRDTFGLLSCQLESGRTHQIRVHMQHIGHPIVGDPLYGIQKNAALSKLKKADYSDSIIDDVINFPRQALHAYEISFDHPRTKERMTYTVETPNDMDALISQL